MSRIKSLLGSLPMLFSLAVLAGCASTTHSPLPGRRRKPPRSTHEAIALLRSSSAQMRPAGVWPKTPSYRN